MANLIEHGYEIQPATIEALQSLKDICATECYTMQNQLLPEGINSNTTNNKLDYEIKDPNLSKLYNQLDNSFMTNDKDQALY